MRRRLELSLPPAGWWIELADRWWGDMAARLSRRRRTSSVDACLKAPGGAYAPVRRRHRDVSSTERRTVGESGVPSPPDPYSNCLILEASVAVGGEPSGEKRGDWQ